MEMGVVSRAVRSWANPRAVPYALGGIVALTGVLLPSPTLVQWLRAPRVDVSDRLLLGATLFRIGLVIIGLSIFVLGRMPMWASNARGQRPRPSGSEGRALGALVAILLVASALRLYGLDNGLWYDEIVAYTQYARMPFGEIVSTYESESQHFLYMILAHAAFVVFGESAWSLRLPAVLFGVGSVWALYLLGRQVAGVREALFSAALLAVSYHHVWFSQNARGYTGLLFWAILSSWLLLRALDERRSQVWPLYATAVALGIYTHVTMLFVVIGHLVVCLTGLLARRDRTSWQPLAGAAVGFGLAALLTLQLHALVLPQILRTIGQRAGVGAWNDPLWTLRELLAGVRVGFAGSVAGAVALVVLGAGLVSFLRTRPAVVGLLLVPVGVGAAVVVGMGHPLWPRFFFFALGFGVLVVVRGAMAVGQSTTRLVRLGSAGPIPVGSVLCTGLVLASLSSVSSAYAPKQDYGGARVFVEENRQPGDTVVTVGLASFPYRSLYRTDWEIVRSAVELDTIRSGAKRTWLLYTIPLQLEAELPEIMASIRRDFRVVRKFPGSLGGGTIFVCRADEAPA